MYCSTVEVAKHLLEHEALPFEALFERAAVRGYRPEAITVLATMPMDDDTAAD